MSKIVRRGALLGIAAGAVYAIVRFLAARTPDTGGVQYQVQPFPMPPKPVSVPAGNTTNGAAVDPDEAGDCPLTHPIKGKLASGIYHMPGAFAYDRTRADRCYRDEAAAQDDGLRAAKR